MDPGMRPTSPEVSRLEEGGSRPARGEERRRAPFCKSDFRATVRSRPGNTPQHPPSPVEGFMSQPRMLFVLFVLALAVAIAVLCAGWKWQAPEGTRPRPGEGRGLDVGRKRGERRLESATLNGRSGSPLRLRTNRVGGAAARRGYPRWAAVPACG